MKSSTDILNRIAEETGVSLRTVRRILHQPLKDTRPSIVARAEKIHEIAKKLNYRPNIAARAVSTGKFNCISLMLSQDPGTGFVHKDLMRGIVNILSDKKMQLNLSVMPDVSLAAEKTMPSLLDHLMADGMLIGYTHNVPPKMTEQIKHHKIPAVWLNNKGKSSCVHPDDLGGGKAAAHYAFQQGHTRIAYANHQTVLSTESHYSSKDRYKGYASVMKELGLEERHTCFPPLTANGWVNNAIDLLKTKDHPTALVTNGPETALPIISAAKELGMSLPKDLLVITFMGYVVIEQLGEELTVMTIPFREVGEAATALLLKNIANPGKDFASKKVPYDEMRIGTKYLEIKGNKKFIPTQKKVQS